MCRADTVFFISEALWEPQSVSGDAGRRVRAAALGHQRVQTDSGTLPAPTLHSSLDMPNYNITTFKYLSHGKQIRVIMFHFKLEKIKYKEYFILQMFPCVT